MFESVTVFFNVRHIGIKTRDMVNNIMQRSLLYVSLLCSVLSWSQTKVWTLDDCVSYAMEHNLSIQQSLLEEERASVNVAMAKGSFMPSVNANANHSWTIGLNQNITTGMLQNQTTQFTAAGVDVGVDVFKGLQNQKQLAKSRLQGVATVYRTQKMKEDVALNVVNAYLQIIFNKEQVRVGQSQLDYQKNQERRVADLVQAGVVPSGDLIDVNASVAQANQQLILSANAVTMSKLALAQLLQLKDYEDFDVADADYEAILSEVLAVDAREVVERAKSTQIGLKIAETQVEMSERDLEISKSAYYPQVRAFYSLATRAAYMDQISGYELNAANPTQVIGVVEGTNQKVVQPNMLPIISGPNSLMNQFDANIGHSFGLGISIPIFNGLNVRNSVKLNKINLENSRKEQELAVLNLEQTVYTAYSDTENALQSYEAAKVTLDARALALEYAKERYEVGLMNVFDFNQAQNLYVVAQSDMLRAKYDYIFKTKILEYYFGVPLFENRAL